MGHLESSLVILVLKTFVIILRFNMKIDQQTGYITKSILCMPIVIQVMNKENYVDLAFN